MRLARDTGTEVVTTRGGSRLSTSIGGTLTGSGADVILIDDPLKASEATSETARKYVKDWYSSTLATRLDDKDRGVIILVMQRLHEEDLAGYLLDAGTWSHLDLPAIALEDARISIAEGEFYDRPAGELLHEERESWATLAAIKSDLGSLAFSAQYQQRPVPLEGNLIKRKWFRKYTELANGPGVRTVQSWDVAGTLGERSDWSVCTTWKIDKKDYYLVHVWRDRVTVLPREVEITISRSAVTEILEKRPWDSEGDVHIRSDKAGDDDPIMLTVPAVVKRNGSEKIIETPGNTRAIPVQEPNPNLIRCIARANDWVTKLKTGEVGSVKAIADQTGMNPKYVARTLKAAFLAPDITEAILQGSQPPGLTVLDILTPFPLAWDEQRTHFGFA